MRKISDVELLEIIQHNKVFSSLDKAACQSLLSRFEKITLAQGEILFKQNDLSDSLYILIEGHLIAILNTQEGKQQLIGHIGKGETVGEMGAISKQPRTLTVKATSDSILLKLTQNQLESFFKDYPKCIFHIINTVIARSQNTIKMFSENKNFKHIAILQGNIRTPLQMFLQNLKKQIQPNNNIILLTDTSLSIEKKLSQAEEEGKHLLFILSPENEKTLGDKIKHINSIYIVVDGDKEPEFSPFVLDILKGNKIHFATQYELILLHDDNIKLPKGTIHWLKLANFTLHHHIRLNDKEHYARITRNICGKAVGIVLGGGGGKGSAALGVLKAVIDSKVPIDAIGGTSAGSIIAAFYALKLNYKDTFIDFKKFIDAANKPFSLCNLTWPIASLVSAKKLTIEIKEVLNDIKIEDLWIPFFAVSCNLNAGEETVHLCGKAWEAVRASIAIPGILPPMVIDGQLHVDGGIVNNLPVDCMRALLGYESIIIGVSLSQLGYDQTNYFFPPILPFRVGFLRKLRLKYLEYIFPSYFHSFIHSLIVASAAIENTNKKSADILISPDLKKFQALNIDSSQHETLINLGYRAALEQLIKYSF